MSTTTYATERLSAAIQRYLLDRDIVPPTRESARIASEITEIVWAEFNHAGVSRDALENLFAPKRRPRLREGVNGANH
jgi:hypothetical protein